MPKDREELQKLTVAVLRDLAKKRLGRGTSKLRTKAQLIKALTNGAIEAGPPRRRVKKPAIRPAKAAIKSAAAPDLPVGAPAPEPLLALPLDARTLLVRWKPVLVREKDERWEVEVFSDGEPTRTIQVAPQSRQARVPALIPGPVYRARLVARAPNGRRRVIGSLSRPVVFFGGAEQAPAPERFVRYSWSEPAASAQGAEEPAPGSPLPSERELAALGAAVASRLGPSPTSPGEWFRTSATPTSFVN